MKRFLLLPLFCALCGVCLAQEKSPKGGFVFTLSENLLPGTHQLMNFAGVSVGYAFPSNDKILLDFSFGNNVTGMNYKSQVLSLMYGHEMRHSERFGTQFAIGPGLLRDFQPDTGYVFKPVGTLEVQHRIYFTSRSFIGLSAKAFVTKNYQQASFIGVTWGGKF